MNDGDVTCTGGTTTTHKEQQQSDDNDNNDYDVREEYFDPGPVPKNVYDRGFVENWKEVIYPISLRQDYVKYAGYSRPYTAIKPLII